MSQEILYTSAPQGLKAGSRGFCTVISTAGMAKNLAERLESMSGYRHHFTSHDTGENPINFSHLKVTVGGKRYHILSRICDAGLDYTKRTNKLAHHIALSEVESATAPGGPAWEMSQDGLFIENWDGEIGTRPESHRKLTQSSCSPRKCLAWEACGVDSGWAGVLAEAISGSGQPMSVVFPSGTDTLALVCEAMALLPPADRWDVTFCTYFTKLPAGVDCQWRFVLDGTREATALRRNQHARLIDLVSTSLGVAPASDSVELARTGNIATFGDSDPSDVCSVGDTESEVNRSRRPPRLSPSSNLRVASMSGVSLEETDANPASDDSTFPSASAGRRRSVRTVVVGVVTLFILVVAVGWYLVGRRSVTDASFVPARTSGASPPNQNERDNNVPPIEEPKDVRLTIPKETRDSIARVNAELLTHKERTDTPDSPPQQQTASTDSGGGTSSKGPSLPGEKDPFDDVVARNRKLELPDAPKRGTISRAEEQRNPHDLTQLFVSDLDESHIELRGLEQVASVDAEVTIRESDRNGTKSWTVYVKGKKSVVAKPKEVATFTLEDDWLRFRWGGEAAAVRLEYCLLDITVGDRTETCSLIRPVSFVPIQMTFDDLIHREELKLPTTSGPMLLEVQFQGQKFSEVVNPKDRAGTDDAAIIQIPVQYSLVSKKFMTIHAQLDLNDANRGLTLRGYAYERNLEFDRESPAVRISTTRIGLKKSLLLSKIREYKRLADRIQNAKDPIATRISGLGVLDRDKKITEFEARRKELRMKAKRSRTENIEISNLDKSLELLHYDRRLEQNIRLVEENQEWCKNTIDFLDRVYNDGRIKFRVYTVVEGVELDVARSVDAQEVPR